MLLLTQEIKSQLIKNWRINDERIQDDGHTVDMKPVLKLFYPCGAATWLITELDAEDEDKMFGLCDLGFGCPELGYVSLAEIHSVNGIERDRHFVPTKTLVEYADEARVKGRIAA